MRWHSWVRGFGCMLSWVVVLTLPAGAQSPSQAQAKSNSKPQAKAHSKPSTAAPQNKLLPRAVSADTTAQLQAMAAAQAAARSAALLVSNTPAGADIAVPAAVAQPDAVVHPQPAHAIELTPATPPETKVLPAVAPELLIAQQIHQGHLPCELGASVRIEADATQPGFFHVHGKGFRYRMFPVQTSTGALRLEDKKAGAVWLQLANKSMLMDQKRGRRLADECAHPDQLAYAETMKTNPPPSLIDTKGLGR